MAHGYRMLQHWNQWLAHQFLGHSLLEAEKKLLTHLLEKHYGKHAVLIGVPQQKDLLSASTLLRHSIVSPLITKDHLPRFIESDLRELPIFTGSIDLVLLPHTLELVDNPQQLLAEACRIIKPEGLIAICGFNPYSAWGLHKLLTKKKPPWGSNFIRSQKIKSWLQLADFELENHSSVLFRPPLTNASWYQRLHYLEKLGSKCCPILGGVYILLARAKVIPLTPIKLKWTQQLSGVRIPTITGHIARRSK